MCLELNLKQGQDVVIPIENKDRQFRVIDAKIIPEGGKAPFVILGELDRQMETECVDNPSIFTAYVNINDYILNEAGCIVKNHDSADEIRFGMFANDCKRYNEVKSIMDGRING